MAGRLTSRELAELHSPHPRVKYHRAKECIALARDHPRWLSPYARTFVGLLQDENNILKWTAIDVLGYLSRVDTGRQVRRCMESLAGFLSGGQLITANHAIDAMAHVAMVRPRFRDRITQELLNVECYSFETEECKNIVLGKVIEAFDAMADVVKTNPQVLGFVARQLKNTRPATQRKAERFMKRAGEH